MGSELLLYGYGFVCVSMLIFNVAYSLSLKRKDRRLKNRDRRFARRVDRQLDRLRTGEGLERGPARRRRVQMVAVTDGVAAGGPE